MLSHSRERVVSDALRAFPPDMPILTPDEVDPARVTCVVLADTQEFARVGKWMESLSSEATIHIYDHHPRESEREKDPRVVFHDADVGATCTLVTEVLVAAGIEPEARDATILLAGLYEDTGQLSFRSAGSRDFAAAHQLVCWGAEPFSAADLLQRLWDSRQTEVLEELQSSRRVLSWHNLRVATARVTLPLFVPDISMLVNRIADGQGGPAEAGFVLAAIPGKVFVIARSFSPGVDVTPVVEALGGGGHAAAASATLRDITLVEAEERLQRIFESEDVETVRACQLMSSPALGVDQHDTLRHAHGLLTSHRIGSIVVFGEGKAVGALDTAAVASALSHGMGHEAVAPYARSEVLRIPPDMTLNEMRAHLYRTGERFFLVEEGGEAKGVVTRRDILRAVYEQAVPDEGAELPAGGRMRHLAQEIRHQLGADAERRLRQLGTMARDTGVSIALVGGCVRDLVLRRRPVDWDLVVEGDPESFMARVCDAGAKVKRYGRFQTAHIMFPDGVAFDLARARRETYARPGALPEVLPGSLEQDLYRRDFTMNAMAVSLMPDDFGALMDRFRGLDDIKQGRIRVLHSLSFVDDPTRAVRALRMAVRFDFALEEQTERLLKRAVALRLFSESEGRRMRREFVLIFREREPIAALRALQSQGMLRAVADYELDLAAESMVQRALEWVAWYTLQFGVEPTGTDTFLLGTLGLPLKLERALALFGAMNMDADEIQLWEGMRHAAHRLENAASNANPDWGDKPSLAMAYLDHCEPIDLLFWGTLFPDRRSIVASYLTQWRTIRPAASGDDLMRQGVPQGPEVGHWLAFLRDRILDGEMRPDRDRELEAVQRARGGN